MAFYQYSARDSAGKNLEGTIEAQSSNEALHLLITRGLRTPRILAEKKDAPRAGPAVQAAPKRQEAKSSPATALQINPIAAAPPPQIRKSKKASDRERFFLFAQVADQLRAGINPAQCFGQLAQGYRVSKFRESLAMVAAAAAEGRPISDVLALWPYLYPEHVVGLMRAGEMGGFMPDAAATISEQALSAHKFKLFHFWIWLVAVNLLGIPLAFMWRQSVLATWDKYEETAGSGGSAVAFQTLGSTFLWPWLPIFIAIIAAVLGLRAYLGTRPMRRFRHEVGLRTPVLGGRARNESVTVFTWVLSRLSRGGVAPNRSWEMAVESVPNLAMQERLRCAGVMMNEGTRLSDVVFQSGLFPQEYAPAVATGELTGDVPGALDRLSQVSRAEFNTGTLKSLIFTGSLGCLVVTITGGILMIVIAWVLDHELLDKATKGTPLDQSSSYSQD